MTTVRNICRAIEQYAPPALQESYDNSGLLVGNYDNVVTGALLCIDVTENVIDEAITLGTNLIVSHHPFIFAGLKKIIGSDQTQRIVIKAIKNNINIFSSHTNIDCAANGVSIKMAQKLDLQNIKPLAPREHSLMKLVTFVPENYADKVRNALFEAGAGKIGNYDLCSYNSTGYGTFRARENTNAFVGKKDELHTENEVRIETVFPFYLKNSIENALLNAHPYEEPAYDFYFLENKWNTTGFGAVGQLAEPMTTEKFLDKIRTVFNVPTIRYTNICKKEIFRVAMCGGAGSFLINDAKNANSDIFISGDIKYHDFFLADNQLIIADIGHYESEQFTKEIFYEIITKNFPTFAVRISQTNTNPINYYF